MAAALFDIYKHVRAAPGTLGTTSGDAVDLESDNLKFALIDTGTYSPDPAVDQYYDDISSGVVGTDQAVTGQTVDTDGTFDCNNPTWTGLSGATVEKIVLYKDTGTASTSILIAILDSANVTGLPLTPSGTDVTFQVDAAGLFA